MQPYDHFQGVLAFVRAVEHGSFSMASRHMGLSPSSVGKAVARLEARLGVRLFQRTTRRMSLTDAGLAFYDSCQLALGALAQAETALADLQQAPAGRVRVAVPSVYGRVRVMPVLTALAERYPALDWDIAFSSRIVDLVEENFDLAVRIGPLEDSATRVARRLGEQALCLCAAPSYLARRGVPQSLDALASHACLSGKQAGAEDAWYFGSAAGGMGARRYVPRQPHMRVGDMDALRQAALAGAGLAQLPGWFVAEDLRAGRLQAVLSDCMPDPLPIHVLWLQTAWLPARLRVVIDELVATLAEAVPLQAGMAAS
ncbi:LysR family transcriptional regulator [Kerstersia similis]|uniref:LysR family transcriptional regulator n=1 Tax=Kerstersia similis TaxID=206505 RepID=UPI0039F118E4